ncbi:MAG: DUF2723 domain-containing protein [Thermodesulfovibrionales bacterium]
MKNFLLLFLASFSLYTFFLTPNINTGDAGDLITASHFLGTAHPSGYPLYLLIVKTFSFLPLGNAAFKAALVSAFFSSFSLSLVCWIVFKLTKSYISGIFTAVLLFTSYSYFAQSVVTKFYPLNLFLILLVIAMAVAVMENQAAEYSSYRRRSYYFIAFVVGLSAANHHTGVIIAIPALLALSARDFRGKPMKALVLAVTVGLVLFCLGFLLNSYIFIRGWSGDFFNASRTHTLAELYEVITRQAYNKSGTISVAVQSVQGLMPYWYGLKNFSYVLALNVGIPSVFLFFWGCYRLFRRRIRLLTFFLVSLALYGPFLSRLTVSGLTISEKDYYVVAHQYFLPAFALFAVLTGLGFHECLSLFRRFPLSRTGRVIPVAVAFIPLTFIISRATDSNYRTNYVPYQATKEIYSILPVGSVLLTFGDNATYQGWYMKLVGRYREDVGQLASTANRDSSWRFEACNKEIYGDIFPSIYTKSMDAMKPFISKKRFFATDAIPDDSPYKKYLDSRIYSLVNLYLPHDFPLQDMDAFLREKFIQAEKIVNPDVCLTHFTDDLFTRRICARYTIHYTELARFLSGAEYGVTGRTASIRRSDETTNVNMLLYSINVTRKNEPYLIEATQIQEYNKWQILYLRK